MKNLERLCLESFLTCAQIKSKFMQEVVRHDTEVVRHGSVRHGSCPTKPNLTTPDFVGELPCRTTSVPDKLRLPIWNNRRLRLGTYSSRAVLFFPYQSAYQLGILLAYTRLFRHDARIIRIRKVHEKLFASHSLSLIHI